jgi:hypothetical protein
MPDDTPVDRLYKEALAVISVLEKQSEISSWVVAEENLRKTLLLAAASHFENRVTSAVADFVREATRGSVVVEQFVRNKAIERQYHTWFQWDGNNANHFFRFFGPDSCSLMKNRVGSRDDLQHSVKAFLELGNERNRLVQQDYASFTLEKTMEEIYTLYKRSLLFVEDLPLALRECDKATRT